MKLLNAIKKYKAPIAAAIAGTTAMASHAAIDVTGAVTEITGSSTAVQTVGVAVLGVCAAVLAIRLIKRVM